MSERWGLSNQAPFFFSDRGSQFSRKNCRSVAEGDRPTFQGWDLRARSYRRYATQRMRHL